MIPNNWNELFGGYVCLFVGDPKICTPYACFATKCQADNWNEEVGLKYPMMTVEEWAKQFHGKTKMSDPFDEDEGGGDSTLDPDWCPECQGSGKVTTADYESYLGANYKPCPKCGGDPCYGEPPIS